MSTKPTYEELEEIVASLTKEVDRYRILFDSIPCTVSWITSEKKYIKVNNTLANIIGMNPDELVGKEVGFMSNEPDENMDKFQNFLNEFIGSDLLLVQKELELIINNQEKYFWLTGIKISESNEVIVFGVDMTEVVTLRKRVIISERLSVLGEMSGGIVHEIANPLTVVNHKAKKIKKALGIGENDSLKKQCENIITGTDKINKIIKAVKMLIQGEGTDDDIIVCNVDDVIEEAFFICHNKIRDSKVELKSELESVEIKVNPVMVYQIIVNLITNACDAIRLLDKKWIEVKTNISKDYVEIYVINSGEPIDEMTANKIFEPFFTSKPVGKGTGLGLPLSRKMAKELGGKLELITGEKTTFCLRLPRAS